MAKIKNPLQFSHLFEIDQLKISALGVLDPTLNVDAKLFIDPMLLKGSKHPEMRQADATYKQFFTDVIKLLVASTKADDIAWRAAYRKLSFREIKGTCLGYGAASINGRGPGPKLARRITATAKEIIDLGIRDPDLFIALPLLEEDVGPDLEAVRYVQESRARNASDICCDRRGENGQERQRNTQASNYT